MKNKDIFRNLTLGLFFLTFSFNAIANETIRFTWRVVYVDNPYAHSFSIKPTAGKQFTINWGDGAIETERGSGSSSDYYGHTYLAPGEYEVIISGLDEDCLFTEFDGTYRNIISIDLSNGKSLEVLRLEDNQLISLDVSKNTKLRFLFCAGNQLKKLDVSNNTALENLYCSYNQLTDLDISNNTALLSLRCYDNQLTNLDVSKNIALTHLDYSRNDLSNLDLSKNTELVSLRCEGSRLSHLDLSPNTKLIYLFCKDNQLSSIDFGNITELRNFDCRNNSFQLSDLYKFSAMERDPRRKAFGTQNLPPQTVNIGGTLDFSAQAAFGGISTVFKIDKNGSPAIQQTDYIINNGLITFKKEGVYTVNMTNSAIEAQGDYATTSTPKVTIRVTVTDGSSIPENPVSTTKIYPNPAAGILFVECKNMDMVKLYDLLGKNVLSQTASGKTEIDISRLPQGIYSIQIFSAGKITETGKVVKQ